jgi:hypothetical protein
MNKEEKYNINLISILKSKSLTSDELSYIKELENKILIDGMVLSTDELLKLGKLANKYM